MKSNGDPYNGILDIIKGSSRKGSDFLTIGKVVAVAPLLIQMGKMPLEQSDILMSDFLVGKIKVNDKLLLLKSEDGQTIVAVSVVR